jgi:carboxyl-terminal processing protease
MKLMPSNTLIVTTGTHASPARRLWPSLLCGLLAGALILTPGCAPVDGRAPAGADVGARDAESAEASASARTGVMTEQEKAAVLERATHLVRERAFATNVDFGKWDAAVAKYQARLDAAETVEQYSLALNRALNEMGISHLDILPPKAAEERRRAKYSGIGVTVNLTDEGIQISDVREGSPAERANLQPGDVITEVDGARVTEWGAIRGKPGTTVNITVKHARDGSVSTFPITRAELSIGTPPSLALVGQDAAVLRLASFTEEYEHDRIEELLRKAKDREMLIVDLRSNGGGSVSNLRHLLSLLLPPGTEVGAFVSKRDAERFQEQTGAAAPDAAAVASKKPQKFRTRRGEVPPFAGKVAVLVNGASASASEIFAAAMRELRGAPLVGTKTAGAVLLSSYVQIEGGFEMKIPTSDYVTVMGHRLEDSPLLPDVQARGQRSARPVPAQQDRAVEMAIEALRGSADAGKLRRE